MGRAASLYRALLRAHRHHLPSDMRQLGDAYVRAEFQRHKKAIDAKHISGFYTEWEIYLKQILKQADVMSNTYGQELPKEIKLSPEQRDQLERLRNEAPQQARHNLLQRFNFAPNSHRAT